MATALCALALGIGLPAQTTAQTTVQDLLPPEPIDPFAADQVIDFREHMRGLIQSIAAYGRTLNPRFIVIARDGLALVGKPDPLDPETVFPARAYARAIDGVMESELLDDTITTPDGKLDPRLKEAVDRRTADLARAKDMQVKVFALEYADAPAKIDTAYAELAKRGYVPYVAPSKEMVQMPDHPRTAYSANPGIVNAAKAAQNYVYLSSAQAYGTTNDYVQAIRDTNYDMVVVDVFANGVPLTAQQIDSMKYKKLGSPRLVLAHIDISTAAPFQYFWQPGWETSNPPFLYQPVRTDPDRHRVIYWEAGWHQILYGDANSYVYGVAQLGFDGVVLTGVDGWRFFEAGGQLP